MAGSLNRATLIGHLGKDPEIRSTQDGNRIASLSLATSESWRDKHSGERKEKTEWHRISIFNENLVDVAEKYLRKGSQVFIEGKISTRKWTDKDGNDRYTTEIVLGPFGSTLTMLGKSGDGGDTREPEQRPAQTQQRRNPATQDLDDEIPF